MARGILNSYYEGLNCIEFMERMLSGKRSAKGRGLACALNTPEATLFVFQQPSVDPGNVAFVDGVQNWTCFFNDSSCAGWMSYFPVCFAA